MALHKFLSIEQRGILANLLGNFAMSIQEPVEIRKLSALAVGIAIPSIRITISKARIAVVTFGKV